MQAMVIDTSVEAGTLRLAQVADPQPGPGEVVIAVRAAAVNRADLPMRRGRYRQPATARPGDTVIAGLECAGEVVAVGSEVTRLAAGDRVMTMCTGGYAELVAVDARLPIPVPDGVPWEQAAALPVALMTEFDALHNAARLAAGERVLITAGGSGVGHVGVQLARALGAGAVLATVLGAEQAELVRGLGADATVDGAAADVVAAVRAATGGDGVDVVIDHVGAAALGVNLDLMALGGRLVSVGRLGGTTAEIDLDLLARKRLRLIGVTFRTRSLDQYGAISRQVVEHVLPAVAAGTVRAVVARTMPLAEALDAQEFLANGSHLGKVILLVGH
jgi:NADPH:quinone reductase